MVRDGMEAGYRELAGEQRAIVASGLAASLPTIPNDLLEERLATLAPATMLRVDEALRHSLGMG